MLIYIGARIILHLQSPAPPATPTQSPPPELPAFQADESETEESAVQTICLDTTEVAEDSVSVSVYNGECERLIPTCLEDSAELRNLLILGRLPSTNGSVILRPFFVIFRIVEYFSEGYTL